MESPSRRLSSNRRRKQSNRQLRFKKKKMPRLKFLTRKKSLKRRRNLSRSAKVSKKNRFKLAVTVAPITKATLYQLLRKEGPSTLPKLPSCPKSKSLQTSNSANSFNTWEERDSEAVLPLLSITTCTSRRRTFQISTSTGSMKGINKLPMPILYTSKFYNSMEHPPSSRISIKSQSPKTHHPSATKNSSLPRLPPATTQFKTVRPARFTI